MMLSEARWHRIACGPADKSPSCINRVVATTTVIPALEEEEQSSVEMAEAEEEVSNLTTSFGGVNEEEESLSDPLLSSVNLIVGVFILIATIFLNGLVLGLFFDRERGKKLRSRSNYFIASLAFADLGVALFVMPLRSVLIIT